MKSIRVEEWGDHKFYFDPTEVANAKTDAEVIECLTDHRGVKPYSPMRCRLLAQFPEGKRLAENIRRLCETGRDKEKNLGKSRKPKKDQD